MRTIPRWRSGLLAVLFCYQLAGAAEPVADIRQLLQEGKAAQAWLLAQRHADRLGQADFDFVYGVAAVNGGRPSVGVLALERVLFADPSNAVARLELARGYFLLGEDARSREEFDTVLASRPPAEVERVVREYLSAIAERADRFNARVSGYLELGGGHDSNVPSGVEDPNITLPVFGLITLADNAVRASDRFQVAGLGLRYVRPLKPGLQLFVGFAGEQRANRSIDVFDQELYSGSAGVQWRLGERTQARFSYGLTTQTIDHRKYRDNAALSLEVGHQLSQTWSMNGGLQTAQFRYGGFNSVRDADYDALNLGLRFRPSGSWRPEAELMLNGAREKTLAADRQDLSRDMRGARLGFAVTPLAQWQVAVSVNWLRSEYSQPDPLLLVTRDDRYRASELSLTWQPQVRWLSNVTFRAEFSDAVNQSNLPLYEYKRRSGALKVRYDFK
jgi:hypothetical protein